MAAGRGVAGRRAVGAAVVVAAVAGGCGQVAAGPGAPARAPTQRSPSGHATTTSPVPAAPAGPASGRDHAFVVVPVTRTVVVAGNSYLAPPPAGAVPRVSAATAFAAARHSWGDPQGTAIPEVVLTSYTNDGQGEMLPDGGIRRFDVNRLVWAVVDSGASCASAGPAGSDHRIFHDCLFISFVDARTGRSRGSMDEGGPGVPTLRFGSSASPRARTES